MIQKCDQKPNDIVIGSEQEFITESFFWLYSYYSFSGNSLKCQQFSAQLWIHLKFILQKHLLFNQLFD